MSSRLAYSFVQAFAHTLTSAIASAYTPLPQLQLASVPDAASSDTHLSYEACSAPGLNH